MKKMRCSWYETSARATKCETCADHMTDSFQTHKEFMQILTQARALHCTVCAVFTGVLYLPSLFWNHFQETEITTISQMIQVVMSSKSFAIAKSAHAKLKMKIRCWQRVSQRLSAIPPSSLAIDMLIFVIDAVYVVDTSVSEIVLGRNRLISNLFCIECS